MLEQRRYQEYSAALQRQADEATARLRLFMATLDFSGGYDEKKAARDAVIEYMQGLVATYGDVAALLAAELYDEIAVGTGVASAVLADVASDESLAGSVRYNAYRIFGQSIDRKAFEASCAASLMRYIKKAANDTMSKNAVRDGRSGAKFARIPQGSETCEFCIMLASRGFVYASTNTAGEFDHFHDGCDCKVIIGFDDPGIDGYDYGRYKDMYDDAVAYDIYGHVDQKETLKNIRESLRKKARESGDM